MHIKYEKMRDTALRTTASLKTVFKGILFIQTAVQIILHLVAVSVVMPN